jgi:hypothetical protein
MQQPPRAAVVYSAHAGAGVSANGLPPDSRDTAQRSPGWMTDPPSSRTRWSVAGRSSTVKYGREAVSPGPGPRQWIPSRRSPVLGRLSPSGRCEPRRKHDAENAVPEAAGPIGIVGRNSDRGRGHGREYGQRSRSLVLLRGRQRRRWAASRVPAAIEPLGPRLGLTECFPSGNG